MYRHAFDFAFEVVSRERDASDVTPEMLRAALIKRASTLSQRELAEACDCFDTKEVPHD